MIWFPVISIPYYLNMCRLVLTTRLIQVGQRGSCHSVHVVCVWGACAYTYVHTYQPLLLQGKSWSSIWSAASGGNVLPSRIQAVGSSGSAIIFPGSAGSVVTATVRPASRSVLSPGVWFIGCGRLGEREHSGLCLLWFLSFCPSLHGEDLLQVSCCISGSLWKQVLLYLAHFSTHS